jgi:hypothetical protein
MGIDDVGQIEVARGDFVQHRREQKKVFAVHDRDLEARIFPLFELERRIKSAEAPAEDKHSCFLSHKIRERCVVAGAVRLATTLEMDNRAACAVDRHRRFPRCGPGRLR